MECYEKIARRSQYLSIQSIYSYYIEFLSLFGVKKGGIRLSLSDSALSLWTVPSARGRRKKFPIGGGPVISVLYAILPARRQGVLVSEKAARRVSAVL